jgi:hypothetical protein
VVSGGWSPCRTRGLQSDRERLQDRTIRAISHLMAHSPRDIELTAIGRSAARPIGYEQPHRGYCCSPQAATSRLASSKVSRPARVWYWRAIEQ